MRTVRLGEGLPEHVLALGDALLAFEDYEDEADLVPVESACACGEDRRDRMAPGRLQCRECRRASQRAAYEARAARSMSEAEQAFTRCHPGGKTCPRCHSAGLPFSAFYPSPGQPDGVQTYCLACTARSGKRRPTDLDRPAYVYRLHSATRLLYVGKTYDVPARLFTSPCSHEATKPWFPTVTRVEVLAFASDAAALAFEAADIDRLRPPHNRYGGRRGLGTPPEPLSITTHTREELRP